METLDAIGEFEAEFREAMSHETRTGPIDDVTADEDAADAETSARRDWAVPQSRWR
jgi:hypothetical protein